MAQPLAIATSKIKAQTPPRNTKRWMIETNRRNVETALFIMISKDGLINRLFF
jgi:hypothetical protein